jgi:invasion protein IalB
MIQRILLPAAALAAFAIVSAGPSSALTAKECSVKYKAAKTGGTLNGLTWNEYRKKECAGVEDTTETKAPEPVVKAPEKTTEKTATKPSAASTATVPPGTVFPKGVDPKYAKEAAGKARMHTCRDQYYANKPTNGNGGLKWIQKGGGYYSLCNASLKS